MSRAPSVMLRLPARPTAVAEARHAVQATCRHLPRETVSDATLLYGLRNPDVRRVGNYYDRPDFAMCKEILRTLEAEGRAT